MRYRIEYADGRCCNFVNGSDNDIVDRSKLRFIVVVNVFEFIEIEYKSLPGTLNNHSLWDFHCNTMKSTLTF